MPAAFNRRGGQTLSLPSTDGSSLSRQGSSGSAPFVPLIKHCYQRPILSLVEGGGFEPPKLARQIYSLIPLATREPLRKGAHSLDLDPLCQQGWRGNSALLAALVNDG